MIKNILGILLQYDHMVALMMIRYICDCEQGTVQGLCSQLDLSKVDVSCSSGMILSILLPSEACPTHQTPQREIVDICELPYLPAGT